MWTFFCLQPVCGGCGSTAGSEKMIVKNCGYTTYEQDIRALMQAFYPGEELLWTESLPADADLDEICQDIRRHTDRFEDKTEVKKALYQFFEERTGRRLPWGTLTGIRPVRIVEMLLQQGYSEEQAKLRIKEHFRVSEEKTDLMFRIYEQEKTVLGKLGPKQAFRSGFSIYIGIPFCPTRCLYCSFTSNPIAMWEERVGEYLDAMGKELRQIRHWMDADPDRRRLQTIYIGGGTPTALSGEALDRLMTMTEEIMGPSVMEDLCEVTVEAGRPDSITEAKLQVLKAHRTDRISVNPQTMQQKTLDLIGRAHTAAQTVESFRLAQSCGFDNINMDLIMGLPGENEDDVRKTLEIVEKLHPESLTVHTLAVKRSSRLSTEGKAWGGVERKGLDAGGMDEVGRMTAMGALSAERMGLLPYYLYRQKNMAGNRENVGYAAPGKECIYNILMMEEKHTVIGVGAGSSTKYVTYGLREEGPGTGQSGSAGPETGKPDSKIVRRFENIKNVREYLSRIDELLMKKESFLNIDNL